MVYLIDTDVMIDVSRENGNADGYLDSLSDPAIPIITAQGFIVGARDKRDLVAISSNSTRDQTACAPSIHRSPPVRSSGTARSSAGTASTSR